MNPKYLLLLIPAVIFVSFSQSSGLEWEIHVVDSSGQVREGTTSLALDGMGNAHISYFTAGLSYATYKDLGPHLQNVTSIPAEPDQTSLALDRSGKPHMVFTCHALHPLGEYWFHDGVRWQRRNMFSGNHGAIAINGQDHIMMVFDCWSDIPLGVTIPQFNYYDGSTWTCWLWFCPVDTIGDASGIMAMATDKKDRPNVAYIADNSGLRYAVREGGIWTREVIRSGMSYNWWRMDSEQSISLDMTHDDLPVVAFHDTQTGKLKITEKKTGEWIISEIDGSEGTGSSLALVLDECDFPHVSFQSDSALKCVHRFDGGWKAETVDSDGNVGRFNSMAIDSKGCLHISYYDATNKFLKYAKSSSVYECAGGHGDVDGNGTVNVIDVIHMFRHILGLELLECCGRVRADCNADGTIDLNDAIEIVKVILGMGICP